MAPASRGLPGFLRRSVRDYSEDDEDDQQENLSASSNDSASSLQEHRKNESLGGLENNQPQSAPAILDNHDGGRNTSITSVSSRASMPATTIPSQTVSLDRQTSEPKLPHHRTLKSSDVGAGRSDHDQNDQPKSQQHSGRPKTYRETQFEKTFAANVVSMNDLKTLAWNGIPPQQRPRAWKILLGYLPTNASRRQQTLQKKRSEYRDAIAQHYDIDDNTRTVQEQEVLRQVLVDVPRTAPTVKLFRDERIKQMLARILYIWAMRHPASSYVQGINDLAMPLIVTYLTVIQMPSQTRENADSVDDGEDIDYDTVLNGTILETVTDDELHEIEADCYWCLTNLLAGIQDHYTSDQPGVQRMVLRLEELVNRIDADLCTHLRETGIEFMQFAFKWMNCLLLREFNLKCVIRLWDTYISEKDGFEDFHVYVCAAFLCQFSSQLQAMTFDELFGFMQSMPTGDWGDTEIEMLLSQAYVLSTLFGGSDAHLIANTHAGRM